MFNLSDFTNLLNETQILLEKVKQTSGDESEELQFKINSNIQALQIMGSKISDVESREKAETLIQSLCKTVTFQSEETITKIRSKKGVEQSDLIDNEILKNSIELKKMAQKFTQNLKTDQKILQSVTDNMFKNTQESKYNTKILEEQQNRTKSSTYITFALIVFLIMYFFIRFF